MVTELSRMWEYVHDLECRDPSSDMAWLCRQFKRTIGELARERARRRALEAKLREMNQDTIGTNFGGA